MNCTTTTDCPFQYQCLASICQHSTIFPIQPYPMFVYLLLPIAATICNLGGLSVGAFKIILFMDMLNYSVSDATNYVYIVITGASLANLLTLLNKRHPKIQSSLVDYNIVILLIPGLLLGTNLGVLVRILLYDIIQDALTIIMLIFFGIIYLKKFITMKRNLKAENLDQIDKQMNLMLTAFPSQDLSPQKQEFIKYKKSYHAKDIIIVLIGFTLLTLLGILCTGKLFLKFKTCSTQYWLTNSLFVVSIILSIFGAYKWIQLTIKQYQINCYQYDVRLKEKKVCIQLVIGSLIAGLFQGIMGIGSGYVMIFCMLSVGILPQVTAAISGFIIFFVGSASLVQILVLGQVQWKQSVLLFGITFAGSFILTTICRRVLKGKRIVDLVVMVILTSICFISVAGVVINIIMTTQYFGFSSLTKINAFCQ